MLVHELVLPLGSTLDQVLIEIGRALLLLLLLLTQGLENDLILERELLVFALLRTLVIRAQVHLVLKERHLVVRCSCLFTINEDIPSRPSNCIALSLNCRLSTVIVALGGRRLLELLAG